jgi:hypothetical protein
MALTPAGILASQPSIKLLEIDKVSMFIILIFWNVFQPVPKPKDSESLQAVALSHFGKGWI